MFTEIARCLGSQNWEDVLFTHWPVPAEALRALVPAALEIESFDGRCWVSIVSLRARHGCFSWLPALPGTTDYCQLNLRTYVRLGDAHGVWFISSDMSSHLSVWLARLLYHLPFHYAEAELSPAGDGVACSFRRAPPAQAQFAARYRPIGEVFHARQGSLEHFLVERYWMFLADGKGRISRGLVEHEHWPLQAAEAEISRNTVAAAVGIALPPSPTLIHYARGVRTVSSPPAPAPRAGGSAGTG